MIVKITIQSGKSAGRDIRVKSWPFFVGRSEECHLRPKSDTISRKHCELFVEQDHLKVRDLGSKNGTIVNGTRIEGDYTLSQGDSIKVGKLTFQVHLPSSEKKEITRGDTREVAAVDADTLAAPMPKTAREEIEKKTTASDAASSPATTEPKQPPPASRKAPEVTSLGEMVGGFDDDDISDWLGEADTAEQSRRLADPDTRQFRLDESQQDALKRAAEEKEKAEQEKAQGEAAKEAEDKKKEKKKEPGKLPKQSQNSANSRAAAEDTLKRFFSRR